jgi:hypothetical protein
MWSCSWRIPNGFILNNSKFHPKLKVVELVSLKYILRTNLCPHCTCFLSLFSFFFFLFFCVNHYFELELWYPRDKTHLVSKGQNSFGIQRTKCGVQLSKTRNHAKNMKNKWHWNWGYRHEILFCFTHNVLEHNVQHIWTC